MVCLSTHLNASRAKRGARDSMPLYGVLGLRADLAPSGVGHAPGPDYAHVDAIRAPGPVAFFLPPCAIPSLRISAVSTQNAQCTTTLTIRRHTKAATTLPPTFLCLAPPAATTNAAAPITVNIMSTPATPSRAPYAPPMRHAWTPSPGRPNMFRCLHRAFASISSFAWPRPPSAYSLQNGTADSCILLPGGGVILLLRCLRRKTGAASAALLFLWLHRRDLAAVAKCIF